MVKVHGPLMSMDASGTLGDAITFSKWKGRAYVRERVIPSNPKSGPQVGMRACFKFLSQIWAGLTAGNKATWATLAATAAVAPFNAFMAECQNRWRSGKGPTKEAPAAETAAGGTAPTTTATGGIRQVQLSIADGGTPPTWGWIIYRSTTTGFTPGYDTAVAMVERTGTPTVFIDAGLTADTYYYRVRGFSEDGVLGSLEAEKSATST